MCGVGRLKSYTAAQLGGFAGKAALAELPEGIKVDSVHFGFVLFLPLSSSYAVTVKRTYVLRVECRERERETRKTKPETNGT